MATDIQIILFRRSETPQKISYHHEVFGVFDPGLPGVQLSCGIQELQPVLPVLLHQPVCIWGQVQRPRNLQLRIPAEIRLRREGGRLRLCGIPRGPPLRLKLVNTSQEERVVVESSV
ncbi:hypothetical protein NPIL_471921 [Nephila pilipes]|uniref:Uncharacterized protein n=1 Tax=Nephila pilipes TaxID=299642 RepID=A0A8X6TAF1_NEPPI|nr:hypothetical protein NPIL_471921 [Nephila pilipes]